MTACLMKLATTVLCNAGALQTYICMFITAFVASLARSIYIHECTVGWLAMTGAWLCWPHIPNDFSFAID